MTIRLSRPAAFLAIASVVFFLTTGFYAFFSVTSFTSPDEIMVFSAAKEFVHSGTFVYGPAAPIADADVVTARHETVINGQRVPRGYLGFPLLLGLIGSLAGIASMYFITPLLTTLALIVFYWLVRKFFGPTHAWRSFLLLFFLSGFYYFAIKSFFPNAAFVSLLVLALGSGVAAVSRKSYALIFLTGLVAGLALSIRSNEIVWVAPIAAILFFRIRLFRSAKSIGLFVLGIGLALVPVLLANAATYGSWLSFGYTESLADSVSNPQVSLISKLANAFIPRSSTISQYANTFNWYGLTLTPLLAVAVIVGLSAWFRSPERTKNQTLWFWISAVLSVWLFWYYGGAAYYGSFQNVAAPIVSSSFVRYLLPISLALIPFASAGLTKILSVFRSAKVRNVLIVLWFITYAALSVQAILYDTDGGIVKFIRKDVPEYADSRNQILARTEPNAIIIAGIKDKQFIGERLVMGYAKFGTRQVRAVQELAGTAPLYYNDFVGQDTVALNAALASVGYTLFQIGYIGHDPLFRVVPINPA